MKIQKPTLGRVVIFTAFRGEGEASGKVDEYAGIVVNTPYADASIVDIKTFGSHSLYSNLAVPHDAGGKAGTWRYPPRCTDEIEVDV